MSIAKVTVTVDEVVDDGAIRVVTLDVARALQDGQVWEELQPYAVIDEKIGELEPGSFVPLDLESHETGSIPKELENFDAVPAFDIDPTELNGDPETAPEQTPTEGALVAPAATTPPIAGEVTAVARDAQAAPLAARLSAANRTKVRDYALKYAKKPNKAYHLYSQDCTNFVSQALKAGG